MERFAKIAATQLSQALNAPILTTDLEIPPDPQLGDFAFPCFKLSKQFKKSPAQVAENLVAQIQAQSSGASPLSPELTEGIEIRAVGPYVNFTVQPEKTIKAVLSDILQGEGLGQYGALPPRSRGSWVLEYSSPNVAKPLNIYHLRPTALGAALDRIGKYRGYHVTSINHLGDWGKQYGMLTVAFRVYGKNLESDLSMMDLVNLYVKINADAVNDPQIEIEAKEAFLKLEQGDPEITALWKKCVDISMKAFLSSYNRLNVAFDHYWGESYYKDQLHPLLKQLEDQGLLVESEGAWVVPVVDEKGNEMPPCILKKSDGATIYATRDVAAAIYRYKQFKFDRMTYIVGAEQRMHFKQVFAVLKKMGLKWAEHCEHVPFGLYRFKDAKMSTRKGNFVTLDEVLELAKTRVSELIRQREAQRLALAQSQAAQQSESRGQTVALPLTPAELEVTSEAVAIGAVVFYDLHTDPNKDIEFDIERVVDFEGETGPYLQYAHTRCLSILRKARESGELVGKIEITASLAKQLRAPEELLLVKTLGQFPLHLERTLTFSKASQLAHYLIDVTKSFGIFYRECKVLGNSPELTQARLALVEATHRILGRGLTLMGIPMPERM